jgi:hypothetical protein
MTWPDGLTAPMRIEGRARDAVTIDPTSPPRTVAEARMVARIGHDRTIEAIEADPRPVGLDRLAGSRGGGHLRGALATLVPAERRCGTPLYLLLDDLSGSSLIAGVAWSRWPDQRRPESRRRSSADMVGICIGFRPGAQSLGELDDGVHHLRSQPVGDIVHPDDKEGWHELTQPLAVNTRRARFIEIRVEQDQVLVESGFQDSVGDPEHGRVGIHAYRLRAHADRATMTLRSIKADPRILPFRECPAAVSTASRLVGSPLAGLRDIVLEELARTDGCTHLNDASRALADVPMLADVLLAELASVA